MATGRPPAVTPERHLSIAVGVTEPVRCNAARRCYQETRDRSSITSRPSRASREPASTASAPSRTGVRPAPASGAIPAFPGYSPRTRSRNASVCLGESIRSGRRAVSVRIDHGWSPVDWVDRRPLSNHRAGCDGRSGVRPITVPSSGHRRSIQRRTRRRILGKVAFHWPYR